MISAIDLSSEEGRKKQFYSIDLMKFICAVLVVAIHVPPFQSINSVLDYGMEYYLTRLAVPYFFIASGYFLFRKTRQESFDKSIPFRYAFRIFKLYLIWEAIYFVPIVYSTILQNGRGITFGILESIRDFLFVGYVHLWYLLATVVAVLIITFLLMRKVSVGKILTLGMFLYLVGLLGQSYFGLIRPLEDDPAIWQGLKLVQAIIGTTRDGLFEGVLFIGIGLLFAWKPVRMKFSQAVGGFVVSMLLFLGEVFFVKYFNLYLERDMTLFLVPAVFFLFYIVAHIELKSRSVYRELRTLGMLVYFIHNWFDIIFDRGLKFIYARFGQDEPNSLLKFVLVLGTSLLAAWVIQKLSEKEKWGWIKKIY